MKTITKQKPWEEIQEILKGSKKVYLIGCGTCATMCKTGGKSQVIEMKGKLEGVGKQVTGWMVIPNVCDELSLYALEENKKEVEAADSVLVMTCAFGVQTISQYSKNLVFPALNTSFIGIEVEPGRFFEVCMQCGDCEMGKTAGICPIVRCSKTLLNGPCGGSVNGKCEVSPEIPCAWQLIIDRLQDRGRMDLLENVVAPHNWSVSQSGGPRRLDLETICSDEGLSGS